MSRVSTNNAIKVVILLCAFSYMTAVSNAARRMVVLEMQTNTS